MFTGRMDTLQAASSSMLVDGVDSFISSVQFQVYRRDGHFYKQRVVPCSSTKRTFLRAASSFIFAHRIDVFANGSSRTFTVAIDIFTSSLWYKRITNLSTNSEHYSFRRQYVNEKEFATDLLSFAKKLLTHFTRYVAWTTRQRKCKRINSRGQKIPALNCNTCWCAIR